MILCGPESDSPQRHRERRENNSLDKNLYKKLHFSNTEQPRAATTKRPKAITTETFDNSKNPVALIEGPGSIFRDR